MRKITLNPESLSVETFAAVSEADAHRGTVAAHEDTAEPTPVIRTLPPLQCVSNILANC